MLPMHFPGHHANSTGHSRAQVTELRLPIQRARGASAPLYDDELSKSPALREVCIEGTGKYLPPSVVTAEEVDRRAGLPAGWTRKHSGVAERRHVREETTSFMGAAALRMALEELPGDAKAIDLLISAGAAPQQLIPCTAALIAREMGWDGVPCFDVNATCLGFVAALETAQALIATGRYQRIAIVCSEIASKGLNWREPESAALLGDGAAAVVLGASAPGSSSRVLRSLMETWPEGAALTEIRGGGSAQPAVTHRPGENSPDFLFHMDGPGIFRLASERMEPFVARLVGVAPTRWSEVDWVIPHQGSLLALRHLRKRLGIPAEKLVEIVQDHGNVVAASIPMALHEAIRHGKLERGQTALLLGTSAGFSMGGVLLRY